MMQRSALTLALLLAAPFASFAEEAPKPDALLECQKQSYQLQFDNGALLQENARLKFEKLQAKQPEPKNPKQEEAEK